MGCHCLLQVEYNTKQLFIDLVISVTFYGLLSVENSIGILKEIVLNLQLVLHGMDILATLSNKNGEGNGTPLQYSCLENPMDGGAWWATVHGVARSWIRLRDFTFTFHFHALGKDMATHSSVLAWRIPGTGEPGGLSSMGSHRVGHE